MSLFELGRSLKNLKETEEKFPVYSLSNQGNSPHGDSSGSRSCCCQSSWHMKRRPAWFPSFGNTGQRLQEMCVSKTPLKIQKKTPVSHIETKEKVLSSGANSSNYLKYGNTSRRIYAAYSAYTLMCRADLLNNINALVGHMHASSVPVSRPLTQIRKWRSEITGTSPGCPSPDHPTKQTGWTAACYHYRNPYWIGINRYSTTVL